MAVGTLRARMARGAMVALVVVAGLGLVPGRAEAFYVPKPAVVLVSKTSSQVTILIQGLRTDIKLQPTAQVIHFSGSSDPYVNYAFLYNPGSGKDGVLKYWIEGNKIKTSFKEYPVSGRYRPFAYGGGIFWYAPGAAPDYIWKYGAAETFTSTPETVGGDFVPVWWHSRMCCDSVDTQSALIWYDSGAAPDMMWIFDDEGGHTVKPITINGDFTPLYGQFVLDNTYETSDILWYSRTGPEYVWSPTHDVTTWSSYKVGDIGGKARPVVGNYHSDPAKHDDNTIFWYTPGATPERYWLGGSGTGPNHTMATFPAGNINGDYRPLSYGGHDVVLLGSGTTGQILHLTDSGPGGSIPLTGLPPGATGQATSMNVHA